MKNITIIGSGRIGNALGKTLESKGNIVSFWDNDPERNTSGKDLESVSKNVDLIFFCIPSWSLREAVESVKKYCGEKTIFVSLSKGIEEESLKTSYLILKEILNKKNPFAVLGGPLVADRILNGEFARGVASSKSKEVRNLMKEIFAGTNVHIEISEDPESVSFSGALKNIYAVLIGIASGSGGNENTIGFLASESIQEMAQILKTVCGNKDSAFKTECAGDFIATIIAEQSKNLRTGIEIGKTGTIQKSEGVVSATSLVKILGKDYRNFKLLSTLSDIIENKKDPQSALSDLFSI